jgi:hypothetical protein
MEAIRIVSISEYANERMEYVLSNDDKVVLWDDGELYHSDGTLSLDEYEEFFEQYGIRFRP